MFRVAYAKLFRFLGLESAALQVLEGFPTYSLDPASAIQVSKRGDERSSVETAVIEEYGAAVIFKLPAGAIVIDQEVLDILVHGLNENTIDRLEHILQRRRGRLRWDLNSEDEEEHKIADLEDSDSFMTNLGLGFLASNAASE
jgi:hypothetical protein